MLITSDKLFESVQSHYMTLLYEGIVLANQVVKIAPAVKINTVYLLFSLKHCTWLHHLLMAEKYHLLTETHGRGPGKHSNYSIQ